MIGVGRLAADAVASNGPWMAWNLTLALVPVAFAVVLFHRSDRRGAAWWLLAAVFLAFLPNAPYVLTDVIHLERDARAAYPSKVISLAVLSQYALFFLVGFEAYVASLILLGRYIARVGRPRWVLPMELVIHGLCAVGIQLGRIDRLNSWDLVARPHHIVQSLGDLDWALVVLAFAVVSAGYVLMKQVTLALVSLAPALRLRPRA
jgi:uncharacterized membrane protein